MSNRTEKTINSYEQALGLSPDEFIEYVYKYIPRIELNINDYSSMKSAGARMMNMSNIMIFLSELEARAGLAKRELKRQVDAAPTADEKKKIKGIYEEMVDKEKVVAGAIHALEIQYRAVNRALTVCADAMKDKYMSGSV